MSSFLSVFEVVVVTSVALPLLLQAAFIVSDALADARVAATTRRTAAPRRALQPAVVAAPVAMPAVEIEPLRRAA